MNSLIKAIGYARRLWPYYAAVTVASLLVGLLSLAIPYILKLATDLMVRIVQGEQADIRGVVWLAVLLLVFDAANTVVMNIGGYLGDMMAVKLKTQLSVRYYEQLLRLPQSYYDEELTGTIINRLNRAIREVTDFLNMFANNFFQMIIKALLTIGVVAYYSWELALMVFMLYPVFLWLTARTSKKWQQLQDRINKLLDIASGRFAEVVSQIRVVKSFAREKDEYDHFKRHYVKTIGITSEQSRHWHVMDVTRGLALSVIFFGIFLFTFTKTADKQFTIGEMVFLITLISALRLPLFSLSFVVDRFQRAITGSRDFVAAMELEPDIQDRPDAVPLVVRQGKVSFSSVDFSYAGSHQVLKGVSFDVKPGEKLALVGESGEGKTTIANLLMRLYEPTGGVIAIDDTDITGVTQLSLRSNIATVFQDPALFSGTIRENIAYGRPDATDEDVMLVAKAANAHDFIGALKDGYDSLVGERGIKLSGGQKQRIAIARALLKDAPILILDEATSSLDTRSEHLVQAALERLMRGRTTLIIAHRLSTIANVDTIVTLRNGRVDEVGPPRKLAKTDGIYAQLLKLQSGATASAEEKLKDFDLKA